jgi:hypothetical protein
MLSHRRWTPGSEILHRKTRSIKLNGTRIVSCKLTNGKEIMDHLRSNKYIRKSERTSSRTHKGDSKTRTVTDCDGRTRGVRRLDRGEDTRIRSSVVGGTRVSDPLGANGRCQAHSAERLRQRQGFPNRWEPVRLDWFSVLPVRRSGLVPKTPIN